MLTIVLWLWEDEKCQTQYRPWHVERAVRRIADNLTVPHRFLLFTDWKDEQIRRKSLLLPYLTNIQVIPLWPDFRDLRHPSQRREFPACYHRLRVFSDEPEMKEILGERFVSIDLDCVITGNLDEILSRKEDFLIYRRPILVSEDRAKPYQASMFMMNTGCRAQVWRDFKGMQSLREMEATGNAKNFLMADQGWILYKLGPKEAGWTMEDGVYSWPWMQKKAAKLPEKAKIVFFHGKNKPWDYGWVK